MDRASWRGILEVEADYIALRDETGRATPIQDLFVPAESVTRPTNATEPVGPGLPPVQTLVYENPTDTQVPALASLLEYLKQDRAPKNVYVSTTRPTAWFPEGTLCQTRRVALRHISQSRPHFVEHTCFLARKGTPGSSQKPRTCLQPETMVFATRRTHTKIKPTCPQADPHIMFVAKRSSATATTTKATKTASFLDGSACFLTQRITKHVGVQGGRGARGIGFVDPLAYSSSTSRVISTKSRGARGIGFADSNMCLFVQRSSSTKRVTVQGSRGARGIGFADGNMCLFVQRTS